MFAAKPSDLIESSMGPPRKALSRRSSAGWKRRSEHVASTGNPGSGSAPPLPTQDTGTHPLDRLMAGSLPLDRLVPPPDYTVQAGGTLSKVVAQFGSGPATSMRCWPALADRRPLAMCW
ncbi:hypothetical protein [Sphingomonas sp.]|uniref:hypothetical protein n=1 Tax=Sphingomonas sp. TaxID=28214 RepID=UPI0028A5BF4B|nr:hypothetical protein [Sphingomonas sp.]